MPHVRAFRALRYDLEVVGDAALVVAPPYDVIPPDLAQRLLARHPKNAVRLDLPLGEHGEDPDERYRRASRTFAQWRSDGTLRKDPRPAVYVYEQSATVPGTSIVRTQRGFFARVRLEPLAAGSGVLPHERTMHGPKEDRYRLLRATGANTSPVVGLYDAAGDETVAILEAVASTPPAVDVRDEDGVVHRLWVVPVTAADADGAPGEGPAERLVAAAERGPIVIADGHHRYETALRYRDERRMTRSCEEDPPFDHVLMLLLEADQPLTVLPTHRVLRGLGEAGVARLLDGLRTAFEVTEADTKVVVNAYAATAAEGGHGRFALLTRGGTFTLRAREGALADRLPAGGDALRGLDVTILGAALDAFAGIDAAAIEGGERIRYTKSAAEAAALVASGEDGADAAFLLEPTPVAAILAVAKDGDVMPQKSTYFYPKALTGLVINPHEA